MNIYLLFFQKIFLTFLYTQYYRYFCLHKDSGVLMHEEENTHEIRLSTILQEENTGGIDVNNKTKLHLPFRTHIYE